MGLEYFLVNKLNKTFFELGKGPWSTFDKVYLHDKELLVLELKDFIFSDLDDSIENDLFINQLATILSYVSLNTDINDLVIINDSCDDCYIIKAKQYVCLGSRYSNEEEGKELNRHIGNTHYFNSIDYINKHPRWNLF